MEDFLNGTPESVSSHVERILRNVSVKGGHLINSGDAIPRETPEENVFAFRRKFHFGLPSGGICWRKDHHTINRNSGSKAFGS